MSMMSQEKGMLGGALGATGLGFLFLFVALAPGTLLTLPMPSVGRCEELVPSPTDTATDHDCGEASEDAILADICHARVKCRKAWNSGYTHVGAVFLHGFLFVLLSAAILAALRPYLSSLSGVTKLVPVTV